MITGAAASITLGRVKRCITYWAKSLWRFRITYYTSMGWKVPDKLPNPETGEMVPMTQAALEYAQAIPYGTAVVLLGVGVI